MHAYGSSRDLQTNVIDTHNAPRLIMNTTAVTRQ